MKRYSFLIANQNIELSVPSAGKLTKYVKTLEIIAFLRLLSVSTLLVFLPFGLITSFQGKYEFNMETSLFIFALVLTILSAGLFLFDILSNITRRIVDPAGLFFVLIFGLITTASAVMVTPTNADNTFGTEGEDSVRALSGIGIMLSIAVYYLINSVYRSKKSLLDITEYIAFGFVIFGLITILFTRYEPVELNRLISNQSLVLVLAYTFSIPFLVYTTAAVKNIYAKGTLLISLFYSIFYVLSNTSIDLLFVISISAIVAALPLTLMFFFKHENLISNLWINAKTLQEKVYAALSYILMLSLFIFIGLAIYAFATNSDLAKQPLENFSDNVSLSWDRISEESKTLLFGFGTSETEGSSTFVGILEGQGLFGFIGYVILITYAISLVYKNLIGLDSEYSRKTLFMYTVSFVLLLVPVLGLFIYVGLYGVLLWWIAFGLLTAYESINSKRIELDLYDFKVENITLLGKTLTDRQAVIARLIIGLTLLIASFILIYSLLNLRGDLI